MNEDFKQYLKQQEFSRRTIEEDMHNVKRFMDWLTEENYPDPIAMGYNDMIGYIQYEKSRHLEVATINLRLNSIGKYYEFLKKEGLVEKNPLRTLRLKGAMNKVIQSPLSSVELENLYRQYMQLKDNAKGKNAHLRHHRNTVILGLLIWQGLHGGELQQLKMEHIHVKDGKIYIPSTSRSNSRELKLSPVQILSLHQYMEEIRESLHPVSDELIPGSVRNILNELVQALQGLNPVIKNALHIRGSVILSWLKQYNKRQVQYMAGHKYISSTEKYAQQDMESLTDELSKHHPFG